MRRASLAKSEIPDIVLSESQSGIIELGWKL